MSILNEILNTGLERYGKYYGTYSGIVFRNNDPSGRGRISVSVPTISKGVLRAQALPKGQWMGENYGSFIVPNVGDTVLIEFINGDFHMPVWSFGPYVPEKDEGGKEIIKFQKRVYRFRTPMGYELLINEQPKSNTSEENSYIEITTPKGNSFKLDELNGNLDFEFKDEDKKTNTSLNINLDEPTLKIEVEKDGTSSTIEMNGEGNIILNGGGGDAVAIEALTDRLNKLQQELISLINDYKLHTHPTAGMGSPSAPTVPYTGTISEFSESEYNDPTVTHPKHK